MKARLKDPVVLTIAAIAVIVPLIWTPYVLDEPFQLPKLIALRLLTLAGLAFFVTGAAKRRKLVLERSSMDIPVLLFVAAAIVATVFAINKKTALLGFETAYEGLFTYLNYALLFFLVSWAVSKKAQLRTVAIALAAGGAPVALYGLLQWLKLDPIGWVSSADVARSFSTLGSPTHLGGYLVLVLPIAIALAAGEHYEGHKRASAGWSAVAALFLLVLFTTYTRASWLGLLAGSVIVLPFALRSEKGRLAVSGFVGAVVLVSIISSFGGGYSVVKRIASAGGDGVERLEIWRGGLSLFAKHPIVGTGPGSFGLLSTRASLAHNLFIDTAVNMGVVGLISLLLVLGVFAWTTVKKASAIKDPAVRALAFALAVGGVAYVIHMQLSFSYVGIPALFWMVLGLSAALPPRPAPPLQVRLPVPERAVAITGAAAVAVATVALGAAFVADKSYTDGLPYFGGPRTAGSIAFFDRAVALNPYNESYRLKLGLAQLVVAQNVRDEAELEVATRSLREAIALDPYNPEGYTYLIQALLQKGDAQGARDVLDEMADVAPTGEKAPSNYYTIGEEFRQAGERDAAAKAFRMSAALDPSDSAVKNALKGL